MPPKLPQPSPRREIFSPVEPRRRTSIRLLHRRAIVLALSCTLWLPSSGLLFCGFRLPPSREASADRRSLGGGWSGGRDATVPSGKMRCVTTATVPARGGLQRILGLAFGLAVVVGSTLGVGILRTPGLVAAQLGTPAAILAVWIAGGLYTLLGSVCLTELGTMLPQAGGYYVYARRAFGDTIGFAVGWTDWLTYCAVLGYISIGLGEFLAVLVPSPAQTVIVVYLLVNVALLAVLPVATIARSTLPAADAAEALAGVRGRQLITVLSLISLAPLLNAIMMIGTRILFAMGRDRLLPARAAAVNAGGTPVVATLVTTAVAVALIATGTFQRLVAIAAFLLAVY